MFQRVDMNDSIMFQYLLTPETIVLRVGVARNDGGGAKDP